jgi:hypothetical protein
MTGRGSTGKMNTTNESAQSQTNIARLPRWLQFSGTVIFVGSAMLSARLIWEQTVWTWERGPQMVGFSLAHGAGAILFIFPLLLLIWTSVVIVLTLRSKIKKREIAPTRLAALALAVSLLVLGELPNGFWRGFSSVEWRLHLVPEICSFMRRIKACASPKGRTPAKSMTWRKARFGLFR